MGRGGGGQQGGARGWGVDGCGVCVCAAAGRKFGPEIGCEGPRQPGTLLPPHPQMPTAHPLIHSPPNTTHASCSPSPTRQDKPKVESCSFDRNAANVFQSYVQVRRQLSPVCREGGAERCVQVGAAQRAKAKRLYLF